MCVWVGLLVAAVMFAPTLAWAQGFLVVVDPDQVVRLPRPPIIIWPPHPPHPPYPPPRPPIPRPEPPPVAYKIQELDVQTRITDQVAQVRVSQTFVNTGSRQLEAAFIFPLPYDGAVDQMTLLVDGKEFPAKLLKADEARRLYENIVRKNRDPALLEWIGTGLFRTNVFPIPPGQKRTVSLRYSQLCRKVEGLTDFLFPLSTAKYTTDPVETVAVRVTVESGSDIKNIYSPTHPVEVRRPDQRHATVTYTAKHEIPAADFRLLYDVGKGIVSTRVLSYRPDRDSDKDGFFLLLASPEIKSAIADRAKKTVILVVDRSGSMSGKKIDQVRAALKFVINNLRPGDLFSVIAYDSEVEAFRPELQKYDDQTRQAALGFAEGIYAGGSTNIDGALRAALGQLQDSSRPNYVVFLTDGLPTTGVTNEGQIVENARQANRVRARIFTFGVGYDVNSRLLDRLTRDAHGQSEYVRPNEDIEDRVSRLYRRIEAPVMTDVKIQIVVDAHGGPYGDHVNRIYPKGSLDLFAGEQLVVVGRYRTPGDAKVVVSGSVDGKVQKFDFPAKLVDRSTDETSAFVEKLWAVRRVGEILEEIDLKGKNEELVRELVELATRHGIITPYTSFLADEGTSLHDVAANLGRADRRVLALRQAEGQGGFAQRSFKNSLQKAASPASSLSLAEANRYAMDAGGMGMGAGGMMMPGMSAAGKPAKRGGSASGQPPGGMPGMTPSAVPADIAGADSEIAQAAQSVRQIGNRTFYRRNSQWIDSTVSKDQEKNPTRIKQFSDKYFELARNQGRTLAQYMAFDEPVLVNLEGRAYLIEP
jgi:Ca-activated chloride channel family protein